MSLSSPARLQPLLTPVLVLLLLSWLPVGVAAQTPETASPIAVPNPAADLWRAVRQREGPGGGQSQVQGVETGVLIERAGDDWRNYRRNDFIGPAGIFIGVVAALILAYYLKHGRIMIEGGRSGKRIKRFAEIDRTLHWLTAILFVFLALSGLILLFGRFVLLPVLGPEVFSVIASASKEGHNLFGPLFLVSVVLLFVRFARKNLFNRKDLRWLASGGGIIGKHHVHAGFFNAGEKIWFWSVILFGLVVSLTGLVLVFPILGTGRELMQLALIVHGAAAVLFIAGSFGHIYIGTIGSEGSLDSMTTGYVDENWARTHHDDWLQEVKAAGGAADQKGQAPAAGRMRTSPEEA